MNSPFINPGFLRSVWRLVVPDSASVAVAFHSRTAPGATFTVYYLSHAKRRPAERRSNMDPALANQHISWLIWADDLSAVSAPRPKPNDKIVDEAGVSWTIDDVEHHLLDMVYHCNSTRTR